MKKLALAAALVLFSATSSASELSKMSVGAAYGFNYTGVLSIYGDYDISKEANNNPVKIRVGWDHYSDSYANYKWSYNVVYGGAYYDFNKILKIDKKIHPIAGLGFGFGTVSCSGNWCSNYSSPTVGGLYYILGAQYDFTPKISGEVNFNGWGGLSLGANYNF